MLILFKERTIINNLKQALYSLSLKDRRVINKILNLLKEASVIKDVPLREPSLIASLVFVV
jgi:hypothetical protein